MRDPERIKLLEKALIKYVELYGFIDEPVSTISVMRMGKAPGPSKNTKPKSSDF